MSGVTAKEMADLLLDVNELFYAEEDVNNEVSFRASHEVAIAVARLANRIEAERKAQQGITL